MFRTLRFIIFVAIAALGGAFAGRLAAEARQRREAGDDPAGIDLRSVRIRPQDLVPGLVAAVRVRDTPWSWLHIPSWIAAFTVNFGVTAVGGDLSRLREMAENAAFTLAGIELPGADSADPWPSRPADEAAPQPAVRDVTRDAADEPATRFQTPATEPSTTWTAPDLAARMQPPPTPGFTPFRE